MGRAGGVIQLDEADKIGCHNGVKVSNTLLDLLDDSGEFTDHFLRVPIDDSNILFIATANDTASMEPWLLDRFTVIFLQGYTRKDKEHIFISKENHIRLSNEDRERFSLLIIPVHHVSEVVETVLLQLAEVRRIKQLPRLSAKP